MKNSLEDVVHVEGIAGLYLMQGRYNHVFDLRDGP